MIRKKGESERKWRCGNCETLHEDESDAQRCCRPSAQEVWICLVCKEEFDDKDEIRTHDCIDPVDGAAAEIEGLPCLCGERLIAEDYRPSIQLGSQVYCERCRAKILQGVPTGDAITQSFRERLSA
jgi:DNA-directed RNA polymerase subunit RPC12/RpoP